MAIAVRVDDRVAPVSPPPARAPDAGDAPRTHEIHRGCTLPLGREVAHIHSGPGTSSRARGRERPLDAARVALVLAVAAPLGGVLFPDAVATVVELPLGVRDTAALLWLLCFLPAWHYLRQPAHRRRPIPILAIMGIEYGMYYALSPLLGLHNVYGDWEAGRMMRALDPRHDYLLPVRLALGGWIAILAGYAVARVLPLPGVRAAERIGREFGARTLSRIGFRLIAFGIGFEVLRWTEEVPLPLHGTLHFLARITLLGIALLHALRARGVLTHRERRRLTLWTVGTLAIQLGTGATYNVILVIFFAFMGRWLGRPQAGLRTIAGAVVALSLFVSIRGVMIDYRKLTWWSGIEYPLLERSSIMLHLLGDRVARLGVLGTVDDGIHKVAERSVNIELLADVVRRTPAEVPFWNGKTYESLVGFAVPRFVWPDKPIKNLGQDFGHRYGYLSDDDLSTQINLPILVEFYANFGVPGVLLGSLLAGLLYQIAERYINRPRQSLLVSVAGLLLLQPLLVFELDFSLQLGGLFMQGVALLGLYGVLRYLWGVRRRAATHTITSPRRAPASTASVRVDTRSFA